MLKNFVVAVVLGLLQSQEFVAGKFIVRKVGTYAVTHTRLTEDTGKLVGSEGVVMRNIFKEGDLIQYVSDPTVVSNTRLIESSPLRVVTSVDAVNNCLEFGKPLVKILYGDTKELDARLFFADSDQMNITLELKYDELVKGQIRPQSAEEITEQMIDIFVRSSVIQGLTYTITPKTVGLKKEASYRAGTLAPFTGDEYTNKHSMRIPFTKVN